MVDLREGLTQSLGPSFTIERELTGGGMSRVFVALDAALGRRVVVKVLPAELAASVSVDRFKREIMLAAALQHPHIVGVLNAGEIDGMPFFTMPFVEGESVRVRIEREGQLAVGRVVSILKDVARALEYAHERGVVHRDIKPDNVLLAGSSATVTDFGIAKAVLGALHGDTSERPTQSGDKKPTTTTGSKSALTQLGTTLGTPAYMAPEQAAADPATDHRADVYAFGIMAYEMLTGQVPFRSKTPQALLAAQLTATPSPIALKRADVPVALARLVMQCLEKEREKRPQSARELAERLDHPDMVSGAFASASMGAAKVRRRNWMYIGGTAILGAIFATWLGTRGGVSGSSTRAADSAAAAAARARSIVVMPFVNIGRDSTDDYLADGITSDLIGVLGRVPGLRVASRSVATSARAKFSSAEEVGKALNAGRILEGTVQRDRNRLRVTARVTNADDGFMVWSDMFERELKDVFAVQDEISSAIADALGAQLATVPTASDGGRGTKDDVAYDVYLRGMHFFDQRGGVSLRRALDYFGKAAQQDPRFARAQAGIAAVYSLLPVYTTMSADSAFGPGVVAATRAIELDSTLAEAYASRGLLLQGQFRWADSERDFRKSIALDPRYASAHQWYGEELMALGRMREAVEHLQRAADLEPLSPIVASSYAMALALSKRDREAVAQARRGIEIDSSLFVPRLALGLAHVLANRQADAIKELEPALALSSESPYARALLGYAYAVTGQRASADGIAQQLATRTDGNSRCALALVQIGMGDTATALATLEAASRGHPAFLIQLPVSASLYDPVRSNPRFRGILSAVGLTP